MQPVREQQQAMIEGEHVLVNAPLIPAQQQQLQQHNIAHDHFNDQIHNLVAEFGLAHAHKTLVVVGSVDEDMVSLFEFRLLTSQNSLSLLEFDCNTQPKLNVLVQKMVEY